VVAACLCVATPAAAQSTSPAPGATTAAQPPPSTSLEIVAAQIRELRMAIEALQQQLAGSRRESDELRQELQAVREQLESLQRASGQAADLPAAAPSFRDRLDALAEEQELLRAKVEDQEQTKVESGSALPIRPGNSGGSLSAGVRQSLLGLEVFGPTLGGARTKGDLALDFFGGFPRQRAMA